MITGLMDRFVELATSWLWLVGVATWRALPILLLVAGLGWVLRRRLAPSQRACLWTIVIVRLLLPVSVGSPLSLHEPIDNWFSTNTGEFVDRNRQRVDLDSTYAFLPLVDSIHTPNATASVQPQPTLARDCAWDEILYLVILTIVIAVTAAILFRGVVSHVRFAIRLRSCGLLKDQHLIDLVLRECDALGVGRRPALREVPSLTAPAVFGSFRHTICLPPDLIDTLNEQELGWVIRHELAHIRRRDIPVMIAASIAGACHWFNPLVWLIVRRLRSAVEAAADRLALRSLSQRDAAAYGTLLLRLAESSRIAETSPALGLISFASGKHLKQRVQALMCENRSPGILARFVSAALVAAIALTGLTDAKALTYQEMPDVHLFSDASSVLQDHPLPTDPFSARESDGPAFIQEYDLALVFASMPESLKSSEKDPHKQLTAWIPLPALFKEKLHIEGHTLAANLSARQHQLLKHTLEIWKNGEPRQISIESRFIQTNVKTACSIDWAERSVEALSVKGQGPAIAARIGENELAQLIRTVSADRTGNILFAPKVTVFDGQTASIADQVQRPFVTGVDPTVEGTLQPVVSILDEGLKFVFTPTVGDDDSVTLAFEVSASSIGKVSYANLPIRTSDQAESQITVQVPATTCFEVSSAVKLAAGESIVVAIPRVFNLEPGADADTTTIVTLTPRIISPQDASTSTAPDDLLE